MILLRSDDQHILQVTEQDSAEVESTSVLKLIVLTGEKNEQKSIFRMGRAKLSDAGLSRLG